MAIANFFDKAALAAAQVLQGYDRDRFAAELESMCPAIAFDQAATESAEARTTLLLLVNLLARLYPRFALAPLDPAATKWSEELAALALRINPAIEIADKSAATFCVVAGSTEFLGSAPIRYVGSSGWRARVSGRSPVQSGQTDNPFGAAAVACLAAANVFRHGFRAQLPNSVLDDEVDFSLLELVPGRTWPDEDGRIGDVDLTETVLVGVGAIGQATLWCLQRMSGLRGKLVIVDPEQVSISNLQRYVLSFQASVTAPKVEVARDVGDACGLVIVPHAESWGEYLSQRADWSLNRVLSAVDSAEDRCAIQAALPRALLNAWTQPQNCGVSRHDFDSANACLACLYLPNGQVPSEDKLVRDALGLGAESADLVKRMLVSGAPMPKDLLEAIAAAKKIPLEAIQQFEGQPLRAFYSEAVCGGLLMALGESKEAAIRVEAPMAFQSALAGVLLAAELVLDARGSRSTNPPPVSTVNLLQPLAGREFSFPHLKAPSGTCICQDRDYLDAYRAKFGVSSATPPGT